MERRASSATSRRHLSASKTTTSGCPRCVTKSRRAAHPIFEPSPRQRDPAHLLPESFLIERHRREGQGWGGVFRTLRNRDVSPGASRDGFTAFLKTPPHP